MASAFFLGLWLVFGLVILGIQFYYFILARYLEKDLTLFETLIFLCCLVISISIFIKSFSSSEMVLIGLISLLPLPIAAGIIYIITSSKEKIQEKIREEKSLRDWLYTIEKQPDNVNAYVSAGDIYFNRKKYETALELYKKAYQIMEIPYVLQRIKTSEKEMKIQKGIIWVCPECSFDNFGEVNNCRNCGYSKIDRNILKDIRHYKKEIIKAIAIITLGPIVLIFLVACYTILPVYIALIITLLVIYLIIRYFTSY